MLDKIVDSCQYLLQSFPGAEDCRNYLNSRLGKDSQEKFKFGYFPDFKNLNVLIDLVGEDTLRKEGLLYTKNVEDSIGPRAINSLYFDEQPLIMPFRDPYGKCVGLVGRTILDEEERQEKGIKKYKNTAQNGVFKKGHLLFGLFENKESIIRNNCVYVVEGQFDVIKATEKGFDNIVALGSASMTSYQFSVISRYTDNIYLLLDNDEAGVKGGRTIRKKFGDFANIQNFYLPKEYKDIDEYFVKTGDTTVSFSVGP